MGLRLVRLFKSSLDYPIIQAFISETAVKGFLAVCLGAALATVAITVSFAAPSEGRQKELINLVKHDCGSCHGLTLKGGLGSDLTPARLRERPAEDLVEIILEGVSNTPMPPWAGLLSEDEAVWIVQLLKKGVPQ